MSQPSPYYTDTVAKQKPPAKDKTWIWVLGGCGGVAALGLIVCCGGFAMVGAFGVKAVTAQTEMQIRDEPEIREHLGELQSVTLDIVRSGAEDGENTFVYQLQGTKGSGELTADEDGDSNILSARLRLKDGTTINVLP